MLRPEAVCDGGRSGAAVHPQHNRVVGRAALRLDKPEVQLRAVPVVEGHQTGVVLEVDRVCEAGHVRHLKVGRGQGRRALHEQCHEGT